MKSRPLVSALPTASTPSFRFGFDKPCLARTLLVLKRNIRFFAQWHFGAYSPSMCPNIFAHVQVVVSGLFGQHFVRSVGNRPAIVFEEVSHRGLQTATAARVKRAQIKLAALQIH